MSKQKTITNRLKDLQSIQENDVQVTVSQEGGTIHIRHEKHHALNFTFKWLGDHFAGYFVDGEGNQSQAVTSLYSGLDTAHFVTAYSLLATLRANQKS